MGDGLVFLAGYAQCKGPCVFIARPTVKDTWAANFLGPSTSSISHLAVTNDMHRKSKLLAIAMQDGSLSVWTYEAAVDRKGSREDTKVILPLCRLESKISQKKSTIFSNQEDLMKTQRNNNEDEKVHFCTQLEWKTSGSSYSYSLLYLDAVFTNDFCVFHVQLPLLIDISPPEAVSQVSVESRQRSITRMLSKPRASTKLAQTIAIYPFSVTHWNIPIQILALVFLFRILLCFRK